MVIQFWLFHGTNPQHSVFIYIGTILEHSQTFWYFIVKNILEKSWDRENFPLNQISVLSKSARPAIFTYRVLIYVNVSPSENHFYASFDYARQLNILYSHIKSKMKQFRFVGQVRKELDRMLLGSLLVFDSQPYTNRNIFSVIKKLMPHIHIFTSYWEYWCRIDFVYRMYHTTICLVVKCANPLDGTESQDVAQIQCKISSCHWSVMIILSAM